MTTLNAHRLHVVQWRDAHGISSENNRDDTLKAHRPTIYWSAGILVQSDTVGVTITQDLGVPEASGEELTYRTRTFIPRELVVAEFDAGKVIRKPSVRKVRPSPSTTPDTPADSLGGGPGPA
jgi:hypothetical protein